jgi:hypothetical protein
LRSVFGYGRPCPALRFKLRRSPDWLKKNCIGCLSSAKDEAAKKQRVPDALRGAGCFEFRAMLSPAYLTRKLTLPIPTKDGGTLSACEYMAAIGEERELRPHWQRVRELMLQEADVAALSSRIPACGFEGRQT